MKNLKILSAILAVSLISFVGCTDKSAEMQVTIDSLSTENADLQSLVNSLQDHLDESTDKYDALATEYQAYKQSTKAAVKKLSAEEKELMTLIRELNDGYNGILVTRDVQDILKFFTDDFTSNVIMVSLYDVVNVSRRDAVTYREHLEHILVNTDKIQYIEVKLSEIHHVEVRNNELGIIYFTDDLTIITNESKKVTAKVLIQIVAKKYEGLWKIGNYTSVNMAQYQENI